MGVYGKDGQVSIGFVQGSVLWCVELEEAASLVGVESGAGNIDIWTFSHVVDFGGDKLIAVKSCC